jgi:uncharacterized protein YbaR (Trm112 family)
MRPIGFSTGALAYSDFRHGLEILRHIQKGAVELSALRERELAPLVESLDSLDLGFFTYVSFHAPSKFEREHETEVIRLLREVAARGFPIVLHPDAIHDVSAWRSFGSILLIENMDKRNVVGRTERELSEVLAALPEAGLCFDMGHCRQVDPTMNESYLILRKFRDRLRQLHVSEVNSRSTHDALSQASICAFEKVAYLIPEQVPVILESPVDSSKVQWEIEQARLALPVGPPAFAVNSNRSSWHKAIA